MILTITVFIFIYFLLYSFGEHEWQNLQRKPVFHSSPCVSGWGYKRCGGPTWRKRWLHDSADMFECRWDERKRITELDCDFVECPVIDTRPQASVHLGHEEKAWNSRGRWKTKPSFPLDRHGMERLSNKNGSTIVPNAYSVHFRFNQSIVSFSHIWGSNVLMHAHFERTQASQWQDLLFSFWFWVNSVFSSFALSILPKRWRLKIEIS